MIAATRSQKNVAGERLEDLTKTPSNPPSEMEKHALRKIKKKLESARWESALKQAETKANDVPELPFVDVPLYQLWEEGKQKQKVCSWTKTVLRSCLEFQNCQWSQVL